MVVVGGKPRLADIAALVKGDKVEGVEGVLHGQAFSVHEVDRCLCEGVGRAARALWCGRRQGLVLGALPPSGQLAVGNRPGAQWKSKD